jgi:hypothetical protein
VGVLLASKGCTSRRQVFELPPGWRDYFIFMYIWIFSVFLHFLVKGNRGGGRAEEWAATRGGTPGISPAEANGGKEPPRRENRADVGPRERARGRPRHLAALGRPRPLLRRRLGPVGSKGPGRAVNLGWAHVVMLLFLFFSFFG